MGFRRPNQEAERAAKPPRRPPILIVEDDENIATYLKYMLEAEGYKAVVMRDGREVVALLDRAGPPRLVLLDVKLPYHDGFTLLTHMRAKPKWDEVPILMLSSVSDERNVKRALEAGATDFLVKPIEAAHLIHRVRTFVPDPATSVL